MKSFYYQTIISNDLSFINKDYKIVKNEIEEKLNLIEIQYKNINKEKKDCSLLMKKFEEKMNYLNDNINKYINEDLTPEEKEYINLNQKLNELKSEKKKLKFDFIHYENEINYNAEKIKYKIEDLKEKNKLLRKNILTCKEEIKLKNHQNKLVIKGQISVYKKKYGDNMELYNKFVKRIDESLKQDDEVNKKENINMNKKNKYYSNSNSLFNTQSTFYKSNEKQNQRAYYYTPEKMHINSNNKKIYFY